MRAHEIYDILELTVRVHRLDAETLLNGWDLAIARQAVLKSLTPDQLVDFLRDALNRRQQELAIARWWEAN